MAPLPPVDPNVLEQQLKDTIQSLHNIMVQVTLYGTNNTNSNSPNTSIETRDVLASELTALSRSLQAVHRTSTTRSLPQVPPELVQYVDNGRNPDIYTREFVELVRRGNQLMRGKQGAFAAFSRVLASEIENAMPELRDDAASVVAATNVNVNTSDAGGSKGSGVAGVNT
ncbi:transcription factor subunit Med10 of mediator complex-domain-containing protein [Poronia punctata]|nr:transcription factor subunit Med10 of mediator complex-domain-containing protein [Poronia punctata]